VEITPEIRQAVAEDECRRGGHDVDVVVTFGSGEPVRVICGRCGRTWPVGSGVDGVSPAGDPNDVDGP
jgi:hypothetical protein